MPEGVHGYPRFAGALSSGPTFPVIAAEEIRRARFNHWFQYAAVLVIAYTVLFLGNLYQLSRTRGDLVHTMDNFLAFLDLLPWGALGVAAVMAAPALLEDARHGALELYYARAVRRFDYLFGKILAVFALSWLAIALPALLYVGMSYLIFDAHPEGWALVPLKVMAYALMWAALGTGLGLGLSSVARSSRAATLILFGGFVILDLFISNLLEGITRDGRAQILSPLSALKQQETWIFGVDAPFGFPYWWGLLAWAGLTILGWALVAWKHPRLRGE